MPDTSKRRRLELVFRQVAVLPALPAVAARLVSHGPSEPHPRELADLIRADLALAARVIALDSVRDADRGDGATDLDRAAERLGYHGLRNAVITVKLFQAFRGRPEERSPGREATESDREADGVGGAGAPAAAMDLIEFWRHSVAVAIAAELLATAGTSDLPPGDAYLCGLVHDIGKLALNEVLPKGYARVRQLAALHQGNIAEFERRLLGFDHHLAGKWLAERWRLPHALQDSIWLHGTPLELLPRLEHRRLIGLVSLADLVARQRRLGYSGNFSVGQDAAALADELSLDPSILVTALQPLQGELVRRSRALGLETRLSPDEPRATRGEAAGEERSEGPGQSSRGAERGPRLAPAQGQALEAIAAFHAAASPGRSVIDAMGAVLASAESVLGLGFYAALCETRHAGADEAGPSSQDGTAGRAWLLVQASSDPAGSATLTTQLIDPPAGPPSNFPLELDAPAGTSLKDVAPWIAESLRGAPDLDEIRILPLASGWGVAGVLLHDRVALPPATQLAALTATWGSAVAAAGQHEGARRLGEELADASRALAGAQERLLAAESMLRLGEMAAGAAHEMNNPLAVISGRSQLLAKTLPVGSQEQQAAATIAEQAERLSALITAMRLFAEPPKPKRIPTDVRALLQATITRVHEAADPECDTPIHLQVRGALPLVSLDPVQIGEALAEIVANAIQSGPRSAVHVSAAVEPLERRLMIQTSDDGAGMDAHTLAHAMDPFFSAKKAGRRVGMGLTRAQQVAAAHGGRIELRSAVDEGTTVTLILPLDFAE